jgi:hypothetical protein
MVRSERESVEEERDRSRRHPNVGRITLERGENNILICRIIWIYPGKLH